MARYKVTIRDTTTGFETVVTYSYEEKFADKTSPEVRKKDFEMRVFIRERIESELNNPRLQVVRIEEIG